MKKYRFLNHTADIKVEAWGETLEDAFKNAATAFFDIILDIEKVGRKIDWEIMAEGFDLESLLFNWIDRLIIVFELNRLVFRDFNIVIHEKPDLYKLSATGYGEKYNKERHGYKVHVKAMTYHEMEIKRETGKYIIRYVVDV